MNDFPTCANCEHCYDLAVYPSSDETESKITCLNHEIEGWKRKIQLDSPACPFRLPGEPHLDGLPF